MRFRYSTSDPSQNVLDSLPRVPLTLRHDRQQVAALGLVDSGATVNVLPYELGSRLGAVWEDRKARIRLAGNLGVFPAMPLSLIAEVGELPTVKLVFAWIQLDNVPLILGHM